ncbi:uncharacterized protein KGF55_004745 [Candida pseudojiufengensis]|uniref:uncharacterized protein n=1 Tax=Candida pseudojiufengensis TaxID=497109 RepID=UPI002225853F|nr:uncharacterized protein KGF55_004745 [Candida pseudojiufengensis]KAI5960452.1 hypothetical protein KGF55_004745 [Candida pseudojiufengensis]
MRDITNCHGSTTSTNHHKLHISNDIPKSNTAKVNYLTSPIGPTRTREVHQDPLHDLIMEGRTKLSKVKITLPEKEDFETTTSIANKDKTSFHIFEDKNLNDDDNKVTPGNNDNSQIDERPSMQSTPTKVKQLQKDSLLPVTPPSIKSSKIQKLKQNTSKKMQQKKLNILGQINQTGNKDDEIDQEVEDDLACHANHILRMAIDSTMFNSMNSSMTLQNITLNNNDESLVYESKFNGDVNSRIIDINDEEIRAAVND